MHQDFAIRCLAGRQSGYPRRDGRHRHRSFDGESGVRVLGLPDGIEACLFDLDGVLTDTASLHRKAWKAMFDDYLSSRGNGPFTPFDAELDYLRYVDGRTRQDGVSCFLDSRDIHLPAGKPDDDPAVDTVEGLGNRKNAAFHDMLRADGVDVFEGSRRYLQAVEDQGWRIAVVSSSANTREVLEITGLDRFVEKRVDGVTLREQHIRGKPAPDPFLEAARLLGVQPAAAAVFEDALSGVEAGRAGHFGVVVGVDRVGQADALRAHGADIVVTDLADLLEQP